MGNVEHDALPCRLEGETVRELAVPIRQLDAEIGELLWIFEVHVGELRLERSAHHAPTGPVRLARQLQERRSLSAFFPKNLFHMVRHNNRIEGDHVTRKEPCAAQPCETRHDDPARPLLALAEKPFRKRVVTHPKHLARVNILQLEAMRGNIDMFDGKHAAELIIHRLAKLAQIAVSSPIGVLLAVQLDTREPALQGLVEDGPLQR